MTAGEGGGVWRALRGATTVAADRPTEIECATRELLEALITANEFAPKDIVSAIFTATLDLRSHHPAAAARALGWTEAPMLCVTEMEVTGSLPRCIRVLIHVTMPAGRPARHVYLRDACTLRPDLVAAVRRSPVRSGP